MFEEAIAEYDSSGPHDRDRFALLDAALTEYPENHTKLIERKEKESVGHCM